MEFPEIGVPPVIIHFNRLFPDKPSSYWGSSIYGNLQKKYGQALCVARKVQMAFKHV